MTCRAGTRVALCSWICRLRTAHASQLAVQREALGRLPVAGHLVAPYTDRVNQSYVHMLQMLQRRAAAETLQQGWQRMRGLKKNGVPPPEGVQRVAKGGGDERCAEAAREGAHVLRQQVERRQLDRHVRRDACRSQVLELGGFIPKSAAAGCSMAQHSCSC